MFCAHINPKTLEEQSIKDHLESTANMSKKFGDFFDGGNYAYICGLLHDIGKYSEDFQKKIRNDTNTKVDHSTAGAIEINGSIKYFGKLLAYCIAGHHGGLLDGGNKSDTSLETTLSGRLKRKNQLADYSSFDKEINIASFLPVMPPSIVPLNKGGFSLAFFIRMIYSCLVDADFLDTEAFMSVNDVDRNVNYDYNLLNSKLSEYIKKICDAGREINIKRTEILNDCITKSKLEKGLYTLTVPTGGGKTISSLAFAINHLLEHDMNRIIYVIPYTSIIEQTGKIFKNILGNDNVLEHHSNFDFKDSENSILNKLKLSSENWDIPIVVTTNVQFFESLFANKSSRCRKLHNISNSVIIFDEAQMIPTQFLTPCVMAISELVKNYKSTCVLCSATQPALKDKFPKEIKLSEICENTDRLYEFFKRTKVINRGKMEVTELVEEMNECKQVLCIVNSKKHALEIYTKLNDEEAFHLSTRMCPKDRKEVIGEITKRLKENMPCKVVSTQLIEAGVDVDFPTVYRSMAGIDSIVQAGGRCNREGRLDVGIINVFEPESIYTKNMPSTIKRPIEVAKSIIARFEDILSPQAINLYFEELYTFEGEAGLDVKGVFKELEKGAEGCNFNFNFKQVAENFKLIEENTIPIIVRIDDYSKELINRIRFTDENKKILRSIQPYTVNVYENEFNKMYGANKIEAIQEGIYVLRDTNLYKKKTGLEFTVETGIAVFV